MPIPTGLEPTSQQTARRGQGDPTWLADVAHSRDNNFHLLRLLAAAAVLFSHSFPLSSGDKASEPLRTQFGLTPGSISVDLFFLISGLLVTISLVQRNDPGDFVRARFFRIWPALTAAILLTTFILGPLMTTLPVGSYFMKRGTWRYPIQNMFLLSGIDFVLPGVFETTPWPLGVNGSLWTLPKEVFCYLHLLAGTLIVRAIGRPGLFKLGLSICWLALFALNLRAMTSGPIEDSVWRLDFMFCTGAALYLYRSSIPLSWPALAALAVATGLSVRHPLLFGLSYSVALPYAMLCFAYLPRGRILAFNRLGDYSYGTYIYAFPIQQALMTLHPHLGTSSLFGLSLAATLVLAVLSWHLLEKPALALARRPAARPKT